MLDPNKYVTELAASPKGVRRFSVDTDRAYPALLAELAGLRDSERFAKELVSYEQMAAPPETSPTYRAAVRLKGFDPEAPGRYWLEVIYQCVKMDVQYFIGFKMGMGAAVEFRFKAADKERWALRNQPGPALGRIDDDPEVVAAAQGKEAREHYRRLRGFIPG